MYSLLAYKRVQYENLQWTLDSSRHWNSLLVMSSQLASNTDGFSESLQVQSLHFFRDNFVPVFFSFCVVQYTVYSAGLSKGVVKT